LGVAAREEAYASLFYHNIPLCIKDKRLNNKPSRKILNFRDGLQRSPGKDAILSGKAYGADNPNQYRTAYGSYDNLSNYGSGENAQDGR
jgi:hypothetical protein